jgi:hypothetical protein
MVEWNYLAAPFVANAKSTAAKVSDTLTSGVKLIKLMYLFVGSYRHPDGKRKKKNVSLKFKSRQKLSHEIEPWGNERCGYRID